MNSNIYLFNKGLSWIHLSCLTVKVLIYGKKEYFYFDSVDCYLDCPFILIHFVNNEVVNKPKYLWITKDKIKVQL